MMNHRHKGDIIMHWVPDSDPWHKASHCRTEPRIPSAPCFFFDKECTMFMTLRNLFMLLAVVGLIATGWTVTDSRVAASDSQADNGVGKVWCANLIYGNDMTTRCFSSHFLADMERETNIRTHKEFKPVRADSMDLFESPFAIMSGEGSFVLSEAERNNLRTYLNHGGFIVASAGCSSRQWNSSFRTEINRIFPDRELVKLEPEHPVFHTVYDIYTSRYRSGAERFPDLFALKIDGRIALLYSPDGLNDTANAGGNCCCCGGNEVKAARQINVNLLAYALTH